MFAHSFAYIDPGSSNFLFQLLIAGVTTVAFFFSTLKRKIGKLFKKDELETPPIASEDTDSKTGPIPQ